jgi:hypothetical protein
MFDFPPTGGEEGSGDVVRRLVGQRNYRRTPARGEGKDEDRKQYQNLDYEGSLRRLLRRARNLIR